MLDIRKTTLTLMALGLIASPALAMDDSSDSAHAETQVTADAKAEFKTYDQNGDGAISTEEFAASVDEGMSIETFGYLDRDQDGQLNEQEFETLAAIDAPTQVDVAPQ